MKTNFKSINPEYFNVFSVGQEMGFSSVTYFGNGNELKKIAGEIKDVVNREAFGRFVVFSSGNEICADRVITINGKPGPAYDEFKMEMTVMPWLASSDMPPD